MGGNGGSALRHYLKIMLRSQRCHIGYISDFRILELIRRIKSLVFASLPILPLLERMCSCVESSLLLNRGEFEICSGTVTSF